MTDWGVPLNDGFEPAVMLKTLAPELRTGPPKAPTPSTDVYALGRLAYFILSGGEHYPVDPASPMQVTGDNLHAVLPDINSLDVRIPGSFHLLASWMVDRQPVGESLQQQYLLLAAKHQTGSEDPAQLLAGWFVVVIRN